MTNLNSKELSAKVKLGSYILFLIFLSVFSS